MIYFHSLIILTSLPGLMSVGDTKNYGHSKLVLFRGKERFEIDGKSCTVGVAFAKPERFSCACVNGIWAFYGEPCSPLAMVAGNNYCFQMPNILIRQVSTISSPMRALSNSLTVFEPQMASVKTKIYRNVHMNLNGSTPFVTMNSSWTLMSPSGEEGICLNSKSTEEGAEDDDGNKIEAFFCTFANLTEKLSKIGAIFKGCNASVEPVEPSDCQPVLPPTSEDVCSSLSILDAFNNAAVEDDVEGNELDFFRMSRSSGSVQNWGKTTTTTTTTEPTTTTTTTRYPPEYYGAPQWLQKQIEIMVEAGNYTSSKDLAAGRSLGTAEGVRKSESEIIELVKKEWENPMGFTLPPPTTSDPVITDQLWKYERGVIRKTLNIPTPDDMSIFAQETSSKAAKLLKISSDVMKKLCPLQKPEYFDMITEVFLQIQSKIFRWSAPYVKTLDFKRIEASLMSCRENAKSLITPNSASCTSSTTDQSAAFPESLKSEGYEPIIESVWKILVSTHSYCYKNFDQFYNDHHKFTTIMFPFFTNEIHQHWFKTGSNITGEDYAGIIGPVTSIMSNIDQCTFAARKASTFPFHLTRPTSLIRFDPEWKSKNGKDGGGGGENEKKSPDSVTRRKRDAQSEAEESIRTKREDVQESPEVDVNISWKREHQLMGGLGFCLKKYNDPKVHLKHTCRVS